MPRGGITTMKDILNALSKNAWFYILTGIAVALLITSLFLPPLGVISPSVLQGVGEIFAFAALGTVIKAIDNGTKATVKHNNTELSVDTQKDILK